MRKLKILLALLLLLSIFSPGLAVAQTVPAGKTEISVDRKGVMRDTKGNVVDWRLFPFTTYADDCNQGLAKGTARKRPGKMCIDSDLIVKNDLNDKNSAQSKKLREYLAAERRIARSGYSRRGRGGYTAPRTTGGTTVINQQPTSTQLATMEDEIFKRLASDAGFREKLASRLANDTEFVKAITAKIPVGGIVLPTPSPTPNPDGAGIVDPNAKGFFASVWEGFINPFWWYIAPWNLLAAALLLVLLLYLLFSERVDWARSARDRYAKWRAERAKRREAEAEALRLNPPVVKPSRQTVNVSKSETTQTTEIEDELETKGPPLVPNGPPNVGDETEQTQVTARKTTVKKVDTTATSAPPATT